MPLPIAHSSMGLAAYLCQADKFRTALSSHKRLTLLILAILATLVPDLDFLFGLAVDQPGRFHHGPSHSLIAALASAVFFVFLAHKLVNKMPIKKLWPLFSVAAFSHPILDYLTADTGYPFGVPLWWPFSFSFQISPFPFFQDITRHDSTNRAFFSTLLTSHNIKGAWIEVCFAACLVFGILAIKGKTKMQHLLYSGISALSFLLYYSFQFAPY